jgi:hypothetical protein
VRRAVCACLAGALAGCGADFAPGSRVDDFRLLAVGADRSYAAPGETVSLSALWHEPFGRPLSWAWTSCVNPDDTTAAGCLDALMAESRSGRPPIVATGEGLDRFTWTVPDDALSELSDETRPNAMAGILTAACPGELGVDPFDQQEDGALPFHCRDEDTGEELPYDRFAVSVRRIFVRESDANANPALAAVTWDGQPWPEDEVRETVACDADGNDYDDCQGGEEHIVAALPEPDSVESGVDEFGSEFTEQVIVQYYATTGTFEFEARTAEAAAEGTGWVASPSARGGEARLWFVVRDSRGGVSWTSRRVQVR